MVTLKVKQPRGVQVLLFVCQILIGFAAGLGQNTNNAVELKALKLTMLLALAKCITQLKVFSDLNLVVEWMNRRRGLKNFYLVAIYQ